MPDDKLRIGGWVPPEAQETAMLPVLATRPSPPAFSDRATELVPLGPERRPRRVIVLCAVAVVAGTVGMLALLRPSGDKGVQPPVAGPMVFATPSDEPTEPPAPTYTLVVPPVEDATKAPAPTTKPAASKSPTPAATTRRPGQATTTPSLTPGSTVGLAVADDSQQRVHHQNFVARVDAVTSRSSASDRAASRYTVRKGLASADCLSFEAVDHPGYYLRHRVFDMVLGRRDNSPVFDQESTFCAVPAGNDKSFTLVTFYPSRDYVMVAGRDGTLKVTYANMTRGTRFVVRAPL